jgi:superfamily I DNA/RNA helicase
MNPFQRARDEANDLRRQLVGDRASDAVHVRDLLASARLEAVVELSVVPLPSGSQELGGAEANLRREENAIYVLNSVSKSECAYLVAHELGHFKMDESAPAQTIASLKAIAGILGSPGTVQVEAYGARERQELRANVFAREILLPRAVARKLWQAGQGPARVSELYGIELEVVRQQMLDAVLLPNVPPRPPSDEKHKPSPDQNAAADAQETYVNVVAGPGSGKTFTLVERVRRLVIDQGVNPAHILVLTFTNKAALELVDRLRSGGIEKASDIWAGTFHAFGMEFLRKYHDAFKLKSDFVVSDRLSSITLMNEALPTVELHHFKRIQDPYSWLPGVIKGLHRLKEEMISPEDYLARVTSLGGDEAVLRERIDVARIYTGYEKAMREKQLVDFPDLVALPARALSGDRAYFGELAGKFQYILVDEYQDVTFAMVELIRQLAKSAKSLWVVGDVRQAIHHWRGASVESLKKFAGVFRDQSDASKRKIREYPLKLNRRSSPQIVELVKHVGRNHRLEAEFKLEDTQATSPAGDVPIALICEPSDSMVNTVVAAVRHLHAKSPSVPYGKQAILARQNYALGDYASALRSAGVPVLYIGELAQRVEVKRLLCLMQLLFERTPRTLLGLEGTDLALSLEDLEVLMQACVDPDLQRGKWMSAPPDGLSSDGRAAVARLADVLQGIRRGSAPWSLVCDVLLERRWGLPDAADVSIEAHAKRIALWQFAYATRTGDADRKVPTLGRFLLRQQLRRRIGETYSERELPYEASGLDAVRLLTVHGSKGLEFEAVHVTDANIDDYGPTWPAWRDKPSVLRIIPPQVLGSTQERWDTEAAIEMNNLFYVAVSRARRHLFIYERNEQNKRLPQLRNAGAAIQIKRRQAERWRTGLAAPSAPDSMESDVTSMTLHEFETYAKCPLQYFYRFVLNLPTAEVKDVSIRAQRAVSKVLREWQDGGGIDAASELHKAWGELKLPEPEDDLQLFEHALAALQNGIALLEKVGGEFCAPVTDLNGVHIELSDALLADLPKPRTVHVINVIGGALTTRAKFMRPLMNGLQPKRAGGVVVHNLSEDESVDMAPSGAVDMTTPYAVTLKLKAGDQTLKLGKHCAWCSYSTICPG